MKRRFVRGLAPGQTLFVKHGFRGNGGTPEFMWVTVVALKEGELLGLLANDSACEDHLRAGKTVRFAEDDICDWMIVEGDHREGGYSVQALGG